MDESQPTKLVANDTSVVKMKKTEQLPITVDINKICSVRKHEGLKTKPQQNSRRRIRKTNCISPNIYGHYMQIKDEEKRLYANMVKKFSISSIRRKRNNNHRKKVKIRYDFLCNSRWDIEWARRVTRKH